MIFDVVGVGFGPSNIALAIAMRESGFEGTSLFLERNSGPSWHENMLLSGSDIQNNLLRDLITPVDPCSRFSFVTYLHETGNFFHFLNLGRIYPFRKEFSSYVKWAADKFDNAIYGEEVVAIDFDGPRDQTHWRVTTSKGREVRGRALVVGTGRPLNIPSGLPASRRIVHLTSYLEAICSMPKSSVVAVLGASQSAVEILLDLLDRDFEKIFAIHRSFSFKLKDTSPFSDEVYFPEFVDYYHALPHAKRAKLDEQVRRTNYSSVDKDIIDELYARLYEEKLDGKERLKILRNSVLRELTEHERLKLAVEDEYTGQRFELEADLLILATGFVDIGRDGRRGLPSLLRKHADLFSWENDYLMVERDYRVRYKEGNNLPSLYLNGLCESSHGLGDAGSFSLVSLRARDILCSVRAGRSRA